MIIIIIIIIILSVPLIQSTIQHLNPTEQHSISSNATSICRQRVSHWVFTR